MSHVSRKDISRLIIGICAVPILSVWALVSFLPIAGLLGPEKPLIFAVADVLFLLTGFGALLAPSGGGRSVRAPASPRNGQS